MELTRKGKKIFEELKTHCLLNLGWKDIDLYGLELLADALDRYHQCSEIIKREGMTQVAQKSKFVIPRPELAIQRGALETIMKFSDRFGLSPQARKKLLGKQSVKKEPRKFDLN